MTKDIYAVIAKKVSCDEIIDIVQQTYQVKPWLPAYHTEPLWLECKGDNIDLPHNVTLTISVIQAHTFTKLKMLQNDLAEELLNKIVSKLGGYIYT